MKAFSHHLLAAVAGLGAGITVALCFSSAHPDRAASAISSAAAAGTASPPPPGVASGPGSAGGLLAGMSQAQDERLLRLTAALQERNALRKRAALWEAMRDLRPEDLSALIARAEKLPVEYASELLSALVQRWFELDAPAAGAWVLARPMNTDFMNAWGATDPEGAFRAALDAKPWWRSLLMGSAVNGLGARDLQDMMARVSALPPGDARKNAMDYALVRLADSDPDAALAATLREFPAGPTREAGLGSVLQNAADKHPEWAVQKLIELVPVLSVGALGNEMVSSIVDKLADQDRARALEVLAALPEDLRALPAVKVSREWAKKEALPALTWCLENGVDIAHAEWNFMGWEPSVLGGAMENAPREVFAWLSTQPAGEDRDRLLECAFMESMWHTPGPQAFGDSAAMAWDFYRALPEDSQVAKARLFVEKRMEFDQTTNPADWLPQFPAGPARENAIATAAGQLYFRDPASAEKFVSPMPPGPERDAALDGLARSASQSAPAQAATRALEISDPTQRLDTLEAVLAQWRTTDPTAPRTWLQSANLPPDWKQTWLQKNTAKK